MTLNYISRKISPQNCFQCFPVYPDCRSGSGSVSRFQIPDSRFRILIFPYTVNMRPGKMCRMCFRKIARLAKDVRAFRDIYLRSKPIQEMNINAQLKRGHNPYLPAQHNPVKKISQCDSSEFTVRHFNNTPADTENMRSAGFRIRASLFPSEEQTPQREILFSAALEKAATTSTREKPQASEILKDIGL